MHAMYHPLRDSLHVFFQLQLDISLLSPPYQVVHTARGFPFDGLQLATFRRDSPLLPGTHFLVNVLVSTCVYACLRVCIGRMHVCTRACEGLRLNHPALLSIKRGAH